MGLVVKRPPTRSIAAATLLAPLVRPLQGPWDPGAQPMVRIDPQSSLSDAVPAEIAPNLAAASETTMRGQQSRLLALALAAGLLACVASLLAGEVILNGYRNDMVPARKLHPSPDDMRRTRDARLYSAALTFTAMGGFLGLTMGWAGGLARRSVFASTGPRS